MNNKLRNIPKNLWLLVIFVVIVAFFIISYDFLNQKFCNWLSTFTDHDNGEISPTFVSSMSIFNLLISGVIAIATCIYLFVTWNLLINARKEHKENQTLTKNMHSDSLTPYIYLEKIEYDITITSNRNSDLRIHSIEIVEDNKTVKINSLQNIYNIEDLIVKGTIRISINNASNNIADCIINVHGLWVVFQRKDFLHPRITKPFVFNVNSHLKNTSNLLSLLSNKEFIRIIVSAKGPGCSAEDKFTADCFLSNYENKISNVIEEGWVYTERSRKYF